MRPVCIVLAVIVIQCQSTADAFDGMMLEDPDVSYEAQIRALTEMDAHDFDTAAETLGHPKDDIKMDRFQGITQDGVAMFRGIRYATVHERFGEATMEVLADSDETVAAQESGPSCPQPSLEFFNEPERYSEDCLFLDIYVPLRNMVSVSVDNETGSGYGSGSDREGSGEGGFSETLERYSDLPIFISIQGDGFSYVESKRLDGRYLAKYGKVIVVIVNYRTSVLGFLSSGDERIRGNFGLYDQRVAIQWVKQYASSFGGNPDSITLHGYSSGAESVAAQMQNPMNSRDLFQRVILQSGVAKQGTLFYNDKAAERELQQSLFQKLAQKGNCSGDPVACFKEMDVLKLIGIAGSLTFERKDNRTFGAIEDDNFHSRCTDADDILISQYDIMLGTVECEAGGWVGGLSPNTTLYDVIKHKFASNSRFSCAPERLRRFVDFEYTSHTAVDSLAALRSGFLGFVSDYDYVVPALTFANKASRDGATTFVYQFRAHVPAMDDGRPKFLDGMSIQGDDQNFLFGRQLVLPALYSSESRNVSANYLLHVTNFAHTGNPNEGPNPKSPTSPMWEEYDTEVMGIFIIAEEMEMEYRAFAKKVSIWTAAVTYIMSDEVCADDTQQPQPEPVASCSSLCSYRRDWEENYKRWRDVDIPKWREASEKYEALAEKISGMSSCDDEASP